MVVRRHLSSQTPAHWKHGIDFEYTMQTNTGTVIVKKVTSEKDLGLIFDQKLKFTEHTLGKTYKCAVL